MTGITAASGGQTQLNMPGQTGKTFSIYTSANLLDWARLTSVANTVGALQYQNSPAEPELFYRISQP